MQLRLIRHGEVDSTSERAFTEIGAGNARHGDVHVADSQTAGRGRLGRSWSSPAGEGLYLSLVLLPSPPPWRPAALTIAAGLAALDAASALGVEGARLKWPNDVVVGPPIAEAKLAGVLVETRGLDPARPHYVVGLGFNVRQREFPLDLRTERAVASLATLGLDVQLEQALEAVLVALRSRIGKLPLGESDLAADFLRATALLGTRVRVRVAEIEMEGILEGISVSEGLRLREKDIHVRQIPLEIVRAVAACL